MRPSSPDHKPITAHPVFRLYPANRTLALTYNSTPIYHFFNLGLRGLPLMASVFY